MDIQEYIDKIYNKYELFNYTWVVYVLRSVDDSNYMYCGCTNNIYRRLRQHNGIISGGGKYTSSHRPWKLAALIINIQNKSQALKVEYSIKAKNHKNQTKIPKKCPVDRRLYLIKYSMDKYELNDVIYIDKEFRKKSQ